jgi:hypothetical protein
LRTTRKPDRTGEVARAEESGNGVRVVAAIVGDSESEAEEIRGVGEARCVRFTELDAGEHCTTHSMAATPLNSAPLKSAPEKSQR